MNSILSLNEQEHFNLNSPYIYLLSSQEEYQRALTTEFLVRDSLESEGFIHATPRNQLTRLANKYHRKTIESLILTVDTKRIKAPVKWEPATGGLYPHIYGAVNIDAIIDVESIALDIGGLYNI